MTLLPGAPGPNQRWPGSGYQIGSGIDTRQRRNLVTPADIFVAVFFAALLLCVFAFASAITGIGQ